MRTTFRAIASRGLQALRRFVSTGPVFKLYAPQSPPASEGAPLRIALVHVISNLGDAILLFPLLDALRAEQPGAEISVFSRGAGSVLTLHPAVDKLYLFPTDAAPLGYWRRPANYFLNEYIADLRRVWRDRYRDLRFHVCVTLRGGIDPFHSSHLMWMLGGRTRVGYSRALEPERREHDWHDDALATKLVTKITAVHEVLRGAEVLQLAGLLRSDIDITRPVDSLLRLARSQEAQEFLAGHPALQHAYAIVAPGASLARRRWSPDRFAAVTQSEFLDRGLQPVFVGSPSETSLCQAIALTLPGPPPVLTDLSYLELIALCSGAKMFVGNDSAVAHIAGALGVPTVVVSAFASCHSQVHFSSLARTHPVGPCVACVAPKAQLPPCTTECMAEEEHCIAGVETDAVRAALRGLLKRLESDAQPTAPASRAGLHPSAGHNEC